MTEEADFEMVLGTEDVFQYLGDRDAALKHAKAMLAADIVAALDDSGLTVRGACEATGFAAADFWRVRNASLARFTIDRPTRMRAGLHQAAVQAATSRWRPMVRAADRHGCMSAS